MDTTENKYLQNYHIYWLERRKEEFSHFKNFMPNFSLQNNQMMKSWWGITKGQLIS